MENEQNMESQDSRHVCHCCTRKSKGEIIPMSYKNVGKYNLHLKSEKHLVTSGELVIEDCLCCGLDFKTQARRSAHLESS